MDIIISLLLIILIWFLMSFYLIIILYVAINIVKLVKALFTTMPGKGYKETFKSKLSLNIFTFLSKKRFIQIIVAMALINIGLYWMSRNSWIDNKDALHIKAKNYMVAGDVLSRQLEVMYVLFHPDSYKIRPLVWLLHGIYDLGEQYLPDNDAEKAMWYYRFFIYPYAQKNILPYSNLVEREIFRPYIPHFLGRIFYELPLLGEMTFANANVPHGYDNLAGKDFREPHICFLKKSFELLETLSTKPIEDKNMYRAYLQAYSGFAHFYTLKQGYYYNGHHNRNAFFETPWYIEQDKKELEWYLKFEKLFDDPKVEKIYGKKLGKNKVLLYCAILNITEDLIRITYIDHTFSCDGEAIKTYVRVRNLLVGEDAGKEKLFWKSKFKELKQLNASQGEKGGVLFQLSNREIDALYFPYISNSGMYKYIGVNICRDTVYGAEMDWKNSQNIAKSEYEYFLKMYVKNLD